MRHMVFFKFIPGGLGDDVLLDYTETYSALREALPDDILSCRVVRNIVEREQNMDLLVEMRLAGPDSLPRYLSHPLHTELGRRCSGRLVSVASFDCEE